MLRPALVFLMVSTSAKGEGSSEVPPPVPVDYVDLERYAGTWYELAKIPNRFQKGCASETIARYTIREDGEIQVENRCRKADGTWDTAKGVARIVDSESQSRLQVSFVSFLGIRPFWGDYWILGLGDDYEYAVVGSPDRKYGWVLSRTTDPPPETLETIWAIVRDQGFDPGVFEATVHGDS